MKVIAFLRGTWALYLLLLPLPVTYLILARNMDPRSAMLPRGVSLVMIVLIVVVAAMEWKPTQERLDGTVRLRAFLEKWWKTVGLIGLMVALVYAMGQVGFYPAATVFLFAAFTMLQVRGWVRRVVLTAGVMAGSYILFEFVLGVHVP